MSEEFILKTENLGKSYQIYDRPSDRLKQSFFRGRRKFFKEFWALKNMSIQIKRNETVGIIGANGSGKSTLLQLICGVLTPTTGSISVKGRVAALLELGSGFNPEYTGRENIKINAAIMGIPPKEIENRYDDILKFADIGDYIDQPVKNYSSGMYVRLAFAVAVNVSPEILVIDEALAVGDARFRMKCMAKIREFCANGTVIFVSHDMSAIKSLCDKAIWIEKGHLQFEGDPKVVVDKHLAFMYEGLPGDATKLSKPPVKNEETERVSLSGFSKIEPNADDFGDKRAVVVAVRLQSHHGETNLVRSGCSCNIDILLEINDTVDHPIVGYMVRDKLGREIIGDNSSLMKSDFPPFTKGGKRLVSFRVGRWPNIIEGEYSLTVAVADGIQENHVQCHLLQDVLIFKSVQARKPGALMSVLDATVSVSEVE